jgi:hypothetical protein
MAVMSRTALIPAIPAQAFACRSVLSQGKVLGLLCNFHLARQRRSHGISSAAGARRRHCHAIRAQPLNGAAVVAWRELVFVGGSLLRRPFLFFLSAVRPGGIGTGGKQFLQNKPCFF